MKLSAKTLVASLVVVLVLAVGVVLWRMLHQREAQPIAESAPAAPPAAMGPRVIYSETAYPHADIQAALAENYDVPLAKGVPALAVLDSNGNLLYSQKNGEFEAMRRMDEASVTAFLNQSKPAA